MPVWIWVLVLADLVAAILLAFTIAWLSQKGRFWSTLLRSVILLGVLFVVASFLIYFGGWLMVRGLRGS